MSLSDSGIPMTMPIQPANSSGSFGGWGGEGSWFIILFLIFAIFGWGGNGWGTNGNGGGGASPGYVLTSDFANIERKLDGINNGICDSTFALNNGLKDGFAGVTQTINSGFSAAEIARCNAQMAFMQQFNALQAQIASCCCENREAIAQVRYDMATQDCATRNLIQSSTRDVIDNANANSRAILDFLVNDRMRTLESENQSLRLSASQAAQNNYLISQLRPTPVPAYQSCNPWSSGGYGCCGNGCGC